MKDIFLNKGGDMHSITAQNFFFKDIGIDDFIKNKDVNKDYKKARQLSKGINFGFEFGRSAYAFAKDIKLHWTDEQIDIFIKNNSLEILKEDKYLTVATELRRLFFLSYKGLEEMIFKQQEISSQGYVDSYWGARRHLPYLTFLGSDSNGKRVKHLQNIAVNSPVQNFEAVVIYRAMTKIHNEIKRRGLKSKIVAMVHDSIVFYLHKDELYAMYQIIKDGMEDHTSFEIPLTCQLSIGDIWGFGEEVPAFDTEPFLKNFKVA
jgi:DNA polymerase-1